MKSPVISKAIIMQLICNYFNQYINYKLNANTIVKRF
jgi:hypothetical protein